MIADILKKIMEGVGGAASIAVAPHRMIRPRNQIRKSTVGACTLELPDC